MIATQQASVSTRSYHEYYHYRDIYLLHVLYNEYKQTIDETYKPITLPGIVNLTPPNASSERSMLYFLRDMIFVTA